MSRFPSDLLTAFCTFTVPHPTRRVFSVNSRDLRAVLNRSSCGACYSGLTAKCWTAQELPSRRRCRRRRRTRCIDHAPQWTLRSLATRHRQSRKKAVEVVVSAGRSRSGDAGSRRRPAIWRVNTARVSTVQRHRACATRPAYSYRLGRQSSGRRGIQVDSEKPLIVRVEQKNKVSQCFHVWPIADAPSSSCTDRPEAGGSSAVVKRKSLRCASACFNSDSWDF